MAEHLSPLDAMFLELEQADESAHMHIGAVTVFDPPPEVPAPSLDELVARLEERFDALPRFRQRLSSARTGGLSWPTWEDDPHFNIRDHLRHATLPVSDPAHPEEELLEWTADFYSHRLDRSRPLWETVLLDGLPGGQWALASKSHHCLVDGISSVDVGNVLMDTEQHPRRRNGKPASSANGNGSAMAAAHTSGNGRVPGVLISGTRAALSAATHPRTVLARTRAVVEMLIRDELNAAPMTSLNQPIGGTRRYAAVDVSIADLNEIRAELGGTINDVVLAVSAGGLRRLLLSRGERLPAEGLRGQVPVNIRAASEELALGNRLTSLYVHLPVAEADPLRRYQLVLDEARNRKHGTQALGGQTIVQITNLAPPAVHAVLAQSLFDVRLFNVTITNVPASPETVYAFGAPMVRVLPLVPLFARHAVGIAAVSYAGRMVFGLNADRSTVPDLDVLAGGIRESLAQLRVRESVGRP